MSEQPYKIYITFVWTTLPNLYYVCLNNLTKFSWRTWVTKTLQFNLQLLFDGLCELWEVFAFIKRKGKALLFWSFIRSSDHYLPVIEQSTTDSQSTSHQPISPIINQWPFILWTKRTNKLKKYIALKFRCNILKYF